MTLSCESYHPVPHDGKHLDTLVELKERVSKLEGEYQDILVERDLLEHKNEALRDRLAEVHRERDEAICDGLQRACPDWNDRQIVRLVGRYVDE